MEQFHGVIILSSLHFSSSLFKFLVITTVVFLLIGTSAAQREERKKKKKNRERGRNRNRDRERNRNKGEGGAVETEEEEAPLPVVTLPPVLAPPTPTLTCQDR